MKKGTVSIARPLSIQTKLTGDSFTRIIDAQPSAERVFASIDYAQLPAESDFTVRVFLNLPAANSSTPITDPHYAGSFAFFGNAATTGAQAHPHQLSYLVNLSGALQRLKASQSITAGTGLTLQLVAVPFGQQFERPDTQLVLEHVDIITTPVIVAEPPR